MKDIDLRTDAFRKMVEAFLKEEPERLATFRSQWKAQEFRHAYLVWEEFGREHALTLSPEQVKIDEDFYWLYVA